VLSNLQSGKRSVNHQSLKDRNLTLSSQAFETAPEEADCTACNEVEDSGSSATTPQWETSFMTSIGLPSSSNLYPTIATTAQLISSSPSALASSNPGADRSSSNRRDQNPGRRKKKGEIETV